ncbi:MAG: WYL domain-containing protein [Oscillospiraceae bacterium]|nr:WYL domain-containing protein [Oscillospiraceae bacterium]
MQIFSEIYGAYFRTAERLLSLGHITDRDIRRIIGEEAFRDSMLFLPPKLRPDGEGSWGLLQAHPEGGYVPVTKHTPPGFVTHLQLSWLKSKLSDPRMQLFLAPEVLRELEKALADVPALYPQNAFRCFDVFRDGDPYDLPLYQAHFREMLAAVHTKEILSIRFRSGKGAAVHGFFIVLRLEYSRKNDKFRALCCRVANDGTRTGTGMLNIGRIHSIERTGRFGTEPIELEECLQSRRCTEPVVVKVKPERNGVERFMMEFASFQKETERDPETGICKVRLWYDVQDETELLIRLLGFGPVVEILGPMPFRRQAAERVARQYALLTQGRDA